MHPTWKSRLYTAQSLSFLSAQLVLLARFTACFSVGIVTHLLAVWLIAVNYGTPRTTYNAFDGTGVNVISIRPLVCQNSEAK